MADLNKKTLRHFYCRDVLWQSFERMSEEFDRGVDDLVNEAMHLLAREKGYAPEEPAPRSHSSQSAPLRPPPLPPPPRPSAQFRRPEPVTMPADEPLAPPLYLLFQNQRYVIDKDQFIIGRGAKTSDLPIRDGNISRKHAAVVRKNGAYFMKDLGSTNGIDYNGNRVDNKRIEEGDVFTVCDYQFRFTFR